MVQTIVLLLDKLELKTYHLKVLFNMMENFEIKLVALPGGFWISDRKEEQILQKKSNAD